MNLVITMSRRFGTGASQIAKDLSEKLGIPVYDKTVIEHELQETGNDYETEAQVIRGLAQDSCIILGRCASEILKDEPYVFNVYVSALKEDRISRIQSQYQLDHDAARKLLEENDHQRADYYYQNTGKVWGDVSNYHMILDTSTLGIDNCADIMIRYFERIEVI